LRIGIGRPVHGEPPGYVLSDFSPDELITMETAYDRAIASIVSFISEGTTAAMNKANSPATGCDSDNGPPAEGVGA